jgi:hypothetical protein
VTRALTAVVLACICWPVPASAAPTVKLTAAFTPERLGGGTTVHLGFRIGAGAGETPAPVTDIELLYPAGLGLGTSELGLQTCLPAVLEQGGPAACPTNSLMGRGSATVRVPFRTDSVRERARVTLVSGPVQNGRLGLMFFADGDFPVLAALVFPGLVTPAQAPWGGLLAAELPLVASVPQGPDVVLTEMQTTIGPRGILYTERVHGRTIYFHPAGILLPATCPRGGFPFAIRLSFEGGATASGSTAVPCPRARRG